MQVLIDECLDWRLCRALTGHYCVSVSQMGWGGLTNGILLQKAQDEFDVLLTGDRNLRFQQNLTTFSIAVIVLEARSTRLNDSRIDATGRRGFGNNSTGTSRAHQSNS